MYEPPHFQETRPDVLHGLIRAHPLGMLISNGPDGPVANAIPFLLDAAAAPNGRLRAHLAKANPHWRLIADNPASPGPDPMCLDKNAMEWAGAWMSHKTPPAGKVGFIYMLAGGTDASNTDPYATAPSAANHWIKTGSHVMVVGADSGFYDTYPKDADPNTKVPYVMWAGTPYQHLMAPVK